MSATILIWYSHSKRFFNFGHVTMALSHSHAFREEKLATISWFPDDDVTRSQAGSMYLGGFSNPVNWGSVNVASSRDAAPESSGKSAGFRGGSPHNEFSEPGQVLHELMDYADHAEDYIKALQASQLDLITRHGLGARSSTAYRALQKKIDDYNKYYPTLEDERKKNKNQWMGKFVDQYRDAYGMKQLQTFLETRVSPPSVNVTLPTLSDLDVHAGLNDLAMLNWWEEYLDAKKTYNWRKRNCASTVATGLIVGGASYAVAPPRVGMFWAPRNLEGWAKDLAEKYARYELKFRQARADLTRASTDNKLGLSGNYSRLWSVSEWKKQSDAGRWSRRYGTLTSIDEALDIYHKNFADHGRFATRNKELQNLVVIAVLLNKILIDRPQTKRKKAIVELGMQVLHKIAHLKEQQKESLGQKYKNYVTELHETWSHDLRKYKNLDEMVEKQFPDAKNRMGQSVVNPVSPEELIINLKRLTEQLDGYEPDATGILGSNQRRDTWDSIDFGSNSLDLVHSMQ